MEEKNMKENCTFKELNGICRKTKDDCIIYLRKPENSCRMAEYREDFKPLERRPNVPRAKKPRGRAKAG